MSSRKSSKLFIRHPDVPDCSIAGVLEQLQPAETTKNRKIALILHGTMGHKDYLFQKSLAQRLPLDSFRFDFRGNHETPGTWRQGAMAEDVRDLEIVVQHLIQEFGYQIDLLVGHSRGSLVAFRWLCTSADARTVRGYVNASGRYRMHKIYDSVPQYKASFESKGYYEWSVTVARKPITVRVYPEDTEQFANWDTSLVWTNFPVGIHVLTMHGLQDQTVPPYDATLYARALGARAPGTHNLHFIEDADHNFTGRREEIVDDILEWWSACERGELQTGVFRTGMRGKL